MPIHANFEGIVKNYNKVICYFLPKQIFSDRIEKNQARMFLLSHLFGPPLGLTVPFMLFVLDPTPQYDIAVLAISIMAFWIFPFLLRLGFSYKILVILSIFDLNFAIFWSCYNYGGVHSPTVTWVLIIPILSVFYIGGQADQKSGLLKACFISFTIFTVVYLAWPPQLNGIPTEKLELLSAASAVTVMFYIAGMAVFYARVFDAGVELENEVAYRNLVAKDLQRAVEAANAAVSAKSEFLARMSHELRSPLNAIIGYGEILQEDSVNDSDSVYCQDLNRILEAGHYLTRLIDMILDLAKMELGKMTFDKREHDVSTLVLNISASQHDLIASGGNTISIETSPEPVFATVDANRISQVLNNLITNAANNTKDGHINVILKRSMVQQDSFEISVRDTGCGIPENVVPALFESFTLDTHASESRYGGTGLALSVARKLCQEMGGDITVVSQVGKGSTFTVTLPIKSAAIATTKVPTGLALSSLSV